VQHTLSGTDSTSSGSDSDKENARRSSSSTANNGGKSSNANGFGNNYTGVTAAGVSLWTGPYGAVKAQLQGAAQVCEKWCQAVGKLVYASICLTCVVCVHAARCSCGCVRMHVRRSEHNLHV
jgi:hypothetical protein